MLFRKARGLNLSATVRAIIFDGVKATDDEFPFCTQVDLPDSHVCPCAAGGLGITEGAV